MGRKKAKTVQTKAMERAQLIMKVRCGLMTAAAAASQLGVSRKTYYKWEQRGLSALLSGLSDQDAGRPEKPQDPARAVLEKQMADSCPCLKKPNIMGARSASTSTSKVR